MGLVTRSAVLSSKLPYQDIPVPEWGGEARVQAMSVSTRAAFLEAYRLSIVRNEAWLADQALPADEQQGVERADEVDYTLSLIAHSVVAEDGTFIFDSQNVQELNDLCYVTIGKLYKAAEALNRFDQLPSERMETEKKS